MDIIEKAQCHYIHAPSQSVTLSFLPSIFNIPLTPEEEQLFTRPVITSPTKGRNITRRNVAESKRDSQTSTRLSCDRTHRRVILLFI